ncbi:MAG TPA: CDP-alcohol phosphatidyltransferase family protein [Gemmatimonadaceae bacterium]|nr:CDP-alcohol phosphatidyltransferase family protein [Gemmatimonadaceae bacterium]
MPTTPRLLTLPNLLSLARFPLAAAFVLVQGTGARVALLSAAALTDLLDGWLARRGQTTQLGALLDPVADKTFVLVAISAFLFDGTIGTTDYFIVLSRDFAIAIGFFVAYVTPGLDAGKFKARWSGKVVTALQLLALLLLLLRPSLFPMLLPAIAIASAWAIADYTIALHRTRVRS